MTPAVSVSELTKRYGEIEAVRGIDFEVAAGETFGFLGPNGAGKSTTIKILCTLADPTSGTARVAGHDVVRERDTVRRNIGLVFQDTTLARRSHRPTISSTCRSRGANAALGTPYSSAWKRRFCSPVR